MTRILVISDTHGYIDDAMLQYASQVDEVWHAGDVGNEMVLQALRQKSVLRAVYGNIDGQLVRVQTKEYEYFECGGLRVMITHIGGYPQRYAPGIQKKIEEYKPHIFVCGHSHICKVMHDSKNALLFINPGAIGTSGFHAVRTMIQFEISQGKPQNLSVVEYQRKNNNKM